MVERIRQDPVVTLKPQAVQRLEMCTIWTLSCLRWSSLSLQTWCNQSKASSFPVEIMRSWLLIVIQNVNIKFRSVTVLFKIYS